MMVIGYDREEDVFYEQLMHFLRHPIHQLISPISSS
jgi:hypothetical protein